MTLLTPVLGLRLLPFTLAALCGETSALLVLLSILPDTVTHGTEILDLADYIRTVVYFIHDLASLLSPL